MKEIIANRRSVRSFKAVLIEKDKIDSLFEAARWSPSAMNAQPWVYVYAQAGEALHTVIAETLAPGNRVWAEKAPLLIVSLAKTNYENGNTNGTARHDVGMANHAIALQATALGLQAHMMGGFNHDVLEERLQFPPDIKAVLVMAVGYPGEAETLPDPFRERETAPRKRKLASEFVFNHIHK